MKKKYLTLILKVLISTAILWILIAHFDRQKILEAVSHVHLSFFLVALASSWFLLFIQSLAELILFWGMGIAIPVLYFFKINFMSLFYSLVSPGDVASLGMRWTYLSRYRSKNHDKKGMQWDNLSIMALSRFLNMTSLIALITLPFIISNHVRLVYSQFVVPVFLWSFIWIFLFIVFRVAPKKYLMHFIPKTFVKVRHALEELILPIQAMPLKTILSSFAVYFLSQLTAIFLFDLVLAHALHLPVNFFTLSWVVCLVRVVRFVPVTLSGLGTREALIPFLFHLEGAPLEPSLIFAMLGSTITLVNILISGLVVLIELFFSRRKASV